MDFSLKILRRFVYASGGQGHSPCTRRIRFADAGRFARAGENLRKMKTKDKIVGDLIQKQKHRGTKKHRRRGLFSKNTAPFCLCLRWAGAQPLHPPHPLRGCGPLSARDDGIPSFRAKCPFFGTNFLKQKVRLEPIGAASFVLQ
ncbi:MAG: hypothetical protein LBT64_01705 [Puniceicoccales bacterium]|nr:hypothetical protein [Puniceicoccales bacterium]